MEAQWISVNDKMPAKGEVCLIVFEVTTICTNKGVEEHKTRRHQTMATYYPRLECLVSDYWCGSDDPNENLEEEGEDGEMYIKDGFYETMYESEVMFGMSGEVTHWMPLPSLPEKQQNEVKQDGNG